MDTAGPIIPEALAVSGFTRKQTLAFPEPDGVMRRFAAWIAEVSAGRPMFVSDNNGFDWQFINWYFHHFPGELIGRHFPQRFVRADGGGVV